MVVDISIKLDNAIRDDIRTVSKYCGEKIDFIFDLGMMHVLGYTQSSFCMCKDIIDCSIPYNISIEPAIILSMLGHQEIEFHISDNTVNISGYSSNKVGREVQFKLSSDPTANYQAEYYMNICDSLTAGYSCPSIEQLSSFYRISRVNDKSERGVTVSNKYFYTYGESYRYYAKTDVDINVFMLSEDMKSLIEFMSNSTNKIYESSGFIVVKGKGDCFFGIRTADPDNELSTLDVLRKKKPLLSFNIDMVSIKSCIRPIKIPKSDNGSIIFKPKNNLVVIGLRNAVYKLPFEYNNLTGEDTSDIKLEFKIFNKLLQALTVSKKTSVIVYDRYISVMSTNDSILLIGRM